MGRLPRGQLSNRYAGRTRSGKHNRELENCKRNSVKLYCFGNTNASEHVKDGAITVHGQRAE